ncbi:MULTISPECIES: transglycosylase SLT domain-containing protein [Pseudomonas]|jgi:soluble lytic murein transglycosylase-like protein|uniref:transglycosylase SLT domain-containing protein n=1 Tax=Pseudomonas TaxID=286 RepID=UPI000B3635F0|nr:MULTISPECIES: transglycosylase SLT domain-containing protein [Pseudomonas]PMY49125.1 lytic transglycosylase domain-containing protein [Pseudomonas sp. FW305-53]PMY85660.1 lytic transglycosylase domain-containing protein [Pseudomonas sp. FW303-C2]PMY92866.1 lytic transglycosylase domain-containing protein [Pseudomonas sp. FW305-62]PNA44379.1 lytic transglycosylase domain-containing protein [Pseudomonas sp. FW306-2-2C-A10BC]PNA83040.1 lytic transglycosylase domain-containing protein [Pseudomo
MRRILLIGLAVVALVPIIALADIPVVAERYQRDLTRIAQAEWGLDAPVATFAGQIHQESRWKFDARSPVGAQGLGQVMPSTAAWLAETFPKVLGKNEPYNPIWSMQALVSYDRWLASRITAADSCEQAAMILSSYNGGLGWLIRDRKLASAKGADKLTWFGSVERFNDGRSAAAFKENRAYPRLILRQWEPLYIQAGWGKGRCS